MIYIILLAGLILRLINLNQSFWLDEAISALTARQQFPYQWFGISGDFQPPLYYLILHFWMRFGNWQEWFLRVPSVVFGVLTIVAIYKFCCQLLGKKTAVLASLLMATSQFHIYYSQELRMYSLLCLLSSLSMWFFYTKKWLLYIPVGILGLYTNYVFALIVISQFVYLVIFTPKDWHLLKKWLMSCLVIIISFVPWLPIFLQQLETSRNVIALLPDWTKLSTLPIWRLIPQIFLKFTLGRISFYNKYFYGSIFIALVLFYFYIFRSLRHNINMKIIFILSWLLSPLLLGILISLFLPIATVWRLIFLLPPFLILVSYTLFKNKYSHVLICLILLVNLCANVLYWINPKYQRENWRNGINYMEQKDIPVVFAVENGFAPYQWYKKKDKVVCGPDTIEKCLSKKEIFYISYLQDIFDRNRTLEDQIKKNNYRLSDTKNFEGVGFIYYYENSN